MNQREAVIHVMKQNGGYATLGHLYEHTLQVPGVVWKTKTPFASIRRIVQNPKYFFKIRPGLWALNEYREEIVFLLGTGKQGQHEKQTEFSHSYYQGLLVQIGNLKNYLTFVPHQDKNKKFLNTTLSSLTTLDICYSFSFDHFVDVAQTIDVSWFNEREMPSTFIEVEHSTGFINSLSKFVELQDFHANFWIAAPLEREAEYKTKIKRAAFKPIEKRVVFIDYDKVSRLHSSLTEQVLIERGLFAAE